MARIIGIDLGTTNACAAFMENGEPVIITNAQGGRTTPSVVAFTKDGERLVGEVAKRQAVTNPDRTVSSIKRDMGSDRRVKIDGKKYTPQEISALLLQKIKKDAEDYLGEPVTEAVITVPAYFSDSQRQATKDAGRIAGLDVKRIINEPTAAALAYGMNHERAQKIMVYDLGGGTFDVSILEINEEVIEVLATAGNNRLGGDDFDAALTDYLRDEFRRTSGVDVSRDMVAMQRLREEAERAKMELSSTLQTEINLPYLSGEKHFSMTLSRAKFDALTEHLVKATMGPMQQAMQDAGLGPQDLGRVLLVGGSTRIPAVQAAVKSYTGAEPSKAINPDECVAMGAALQGGVMIGEVTSLLLLDVTPLSLGIETMGDVFSRVIDRNTTIPVQRSQIFTTAADFQTSVEIHVLQGERELASSNKTLGKFRLKGIRRAMRGVPQIEVTFSIDANGIVSVVAKDLGTGKHQEITLTATSNMSEAEINRAVREAQTFASEDAQKRSEAELKNRTEQLLYQAKAAKLPKGSAREAVQAAVQEVKQAKNAKDDTRLAQACDALESALAAAGQDGADDSGGDGAQDADFTPPDDQA